MLIFEWDERKAASNLRKHGVTFEEAQSVFYDPRSLTINHPDNEKRNCASSISGLLIKIEFWLWCILNAETRFVLLACDGRRETNGSSMKRKNRTKQREHNFARGVRGKHLGRLNDGHRTLIDRVDGSIDAYTTRPVILDRDVQSVFKDSKTVNKALRGLIERSAERTPR